jgi:hypothetical protein
MANDATHDIGLYNIVFGGVLLTGFADGDSYQMAYDVERFTRLIGGYGLGAWAKSNNFAAGGSITLMSTSNDNDAMQAFYSAGETAPGGVLVPLVVLQLNGRFSHTGLFRITKAPDVSRGTSVPTTTWAIGTTRLFQKLGGTTPTDVITSVEQARALIAAGPSLPTPI